MAGNPCNVSCSEERPWVEGATLFNYLNAVRLQGITGSIALQGRMRGNKEYSNSTWLVTRNYFSGWDKSHIGSGGQALQFEDQ